MKPLLIIAAVLTAGIAVTHLRRRPSELQPTALEQAHYDRTYREIHGGEL